MSRRLMSDFLHLDRNATTKKNVAIKKRQTSRSVKRFVIVLDLDSRLPYPCPVALYLNETFHPSLSKNSTKFAPLFRVLPAATYLEHFYSDRMHMFDRKNQTWSSPPPNYECILNGWQPNEISTSNLESYIEMTQQPQATIYGRVLTLDEMKKQTFTEI